MRRIAAFAGCALLLASAGCGWGIRGVALYFDGATFSGPAGELRSDSDSGTPGTVIDIADDLGADSISPWQARLEILRRRGAVGFGLGFGTSSFTSEPGSPGAVNFNGASVNPDKAEVTLDEYRIEIIKHIRYPKVRTGLHVAFVYADWTASLTEGANPPEVSEQTAFMPVVGMRYRKKLGPFLTLNVRAEGTQLETDKMAVKLVDWSATFGVATPTDASVEVGFKGRTIDLERDGQRVSYDGSGVSFAAVFALGF